MICDLDSKVSHCEKSIKCVKLKRFVINYYSKCVKGHVLPDLLLLRLLFPTELPTDLSLPPGCSDRPISIYLVILIKMK
jgi:hypothetical protein